MTTLPLNMPRVSTSLMLHRWTGHPFRSICAVLSHHSLEYWYLHFISFPLNRVSPAPTWNHYPRYCYSKLDETSGIIQRVKGKHNSFNLIYVMISMIYYIPWYIHITLYPNDFGWLKAPSCGAKCPFGESWWKQSFCIPNIFPHDTRLISHWSHWYLINLESKPRLQQLVLLPWPWSAFAHPSFRPRRR